MRIAVGIPARYASSRFPGKPLAMLAGRPMLAHVIERARAADIGPVFVATDDTRIAEVAAREGVQVCMTKDTHRSGSERLAEAAVGIAADVIVNVQGDEPLIDPEAIRQVVHPFRDDPYVPMATLAQPLRASELHDPNVVKVVCNAKGRAMYFSRAPIPFPRDGSEVEALKHIGLYAYRREFLLIYAGLAPCALELSEQLEQLRVLYHGYDIAVTVGEFASIGVDVPADLVRAQQALERRKPCA
ncbi:MAG: 3-deoxy-manno-octulosonate cytidylyltransferase [Zetaproteobacteria bacterium]|nr:MAG: 3-deoxy-manno-octulosonate cytidylyltransferase [Zetaproteobacteria bacterium]